MIQCGRGVVTWELPAVSSLENKQVEAFCEALVSNQD